MVGISLLGNVTPAQVAIDWAQECEGGNADSSCYVNLRKGWSTCKCGFAPTYGHQTTNTGGGIRSCPACYFGKAQKDGWTPCQGTTCRAILQAGGSGCLLPTPTGAAAAPTTPAYITTGWAAASTAPDKKSMDEAVKMCEKMQVTIDELKRENIGLLGRLSITEKSITEKMSLEQTKSIMEESVAALVKKTAALEKATKDNESNIASLMDQMRVAMGDIERLGVLVEDLKSRAQTHDEQLMESNGNIQESIRKIARLETYSPAAPWHIVPGADPHIEIEESALGM